MWKINSKDIEDNSCINNEVGFTEIMNKLIYAKAYSLCIKTLNIKTNLNTKQPDGGVDTQVDSFSVYDKSGYIDKYSSIWQYKATSKTNITPKKLKKEINSPYASSMIEKGYAYRFCVCDSLTPKKKGEWEKVLNEEAKKINKNTPEVRVLDTGNIAEEINQIPALIIEYFHLPISTICTTLNGWSKDINIKEPRKFISTEQSDYFEKIIKNHIDLSQQAVNITLPICGVPGVGKSRTVFEILNSIESARALVVFLDDDTYVSKIINYIRNSQNISALIVVDECSLEVRSNLSNKLYGCQNVRVITIENHSEKQSGLDAHYRFEQYDSQDKYKILKENYPHLPDNLLEHIISLFGDSLRETVRVCKDALKKGSQFTLKNDDIKSYYTQRYNVNIDEKKILMLLSIFTKIGFKDDKKEELNIILKNSLLNVGIGYNDFLRIFNGLINKTGFVAKGGRYLYLSSDIIAQIYFEEAWEYFAEDREFEFLNNIPPIMMESFINRVRKNGNNQSKNLIATVFLNEVKSFTLIHLLDIKRVKFLVKLIEIEPEKYIDILYDLIINATSEELKKIKGDSYGGDWGPRRYIVWLCESLLSFHEYFNRAEEMLFKLALSESEPKIGNNATAIWKQIFKIYLSRTSIHFNDRLDLLKNRIFSKDHLTFYLCLDALKNIFDKHHVRVMGNPVFGGRIVPGDWEPKTIDEEHKCHKKAFEFIAEYIYAIEVDSQRKSRLLDLLIEKIWSLLRFGFIDNLKELFKGGDLNDEQRIKLIQGIEKFIHLHRNDENIKKEFIDALSDWIQDLKSKDNINIRLKGIIGVEPWHARSINKEDDWKKELQQVSEECISNPNIIEENLEWLCSTNAKSSFTLGRYLGEEDAKGILFDLIINSCLKFNSSALSAGYIQSIVLKHPSLLQKVNEFIDGIQESSPKIAFELFTAGWRKTNSVERAINLVESEKLPVGVMKHFSFYGELNEITESDVANILRVIENYLEKDIEEASNTFLHFLGPLLEHSRLIKKEGVNLFENEKIRDLSWKLLGNCHTGDTMEVHYWKEIMRNLTDYNPDKSLEIVIQGISSDSLDFTDASYEILSKLEKSNPDLVMDKIGELLLDKSKNWKLFIDTNVSKTIFMNIPTQIIVNWIDKHGLEAARNAAFLLPIPHLDSDKNTIIPELTEYILIKYGSDEKVFKNFCAGSHGMRVYSGDIAKIKENEAEELKPFLNHKLGFVREWAKGMIDSAKYEADWHRQEEEEFGLE